MSKKLSDLELFSGLNKETIDSLTSLCIEKHYKKGEHIFFDKDKVTTVFIVLKGKVTLYKIGEKAHKRIVFILGEGSIINDVVLDDLPASISCEAFEDSEILCFDRDEFVKVMSNDFQLTTVVINSLSKKVRRLYRQIKNATPIKVEKRVAAKLWKLAKDHWLEVEDGIEIGLNISITYLADMFGTPRETISRALKVLQKEELIVLNGKKIIVKDKDKLAKYFKNN